MTGQAIGGVARAERLLEAMEIGLEADDPDKIDTSDEIRGTIEQLVSELTETSSMSTTVTINVTPSQAAACRERINRIEAAGIATSDDLPTLIAFARYGLERAEARYQSAVRAHIENFADDHAG